MRPAVLNIVGFSLGVVDLVAGETQLGMQKIEGRMTDEQRDG
jgi:hypothetical protein